ncbi:hypothetical protein APHWI1_1261 [Anaplasma phagocytophilum str. ApWI1]|uniref:Uncharacterized protein n=1 Tax=Anaplasma phagocytophilum str. ApWI1 TaxID=1359155 RepID=A0A0F3PWU0_ANAPH|nr:hypothetical protein APHHGE2_0488 [Anaplasma phagocytophilum str. HGE2]KJV84361.1 hypothetical protein APHWI1_1261 [Anaplasma phagocytophilum str. ApWI1]KJV99225.1 hypothetical protein OTSANNIE_0459 [Anaplasma phagocytophilum str. Annie]
MYTRSYPIPSINRRSKGLMPTRFRYVIREKAGDIRGEI